MRFRLSFVAVICACLWWAQAFSQTNIIGGGVWGDVKVGGAVSSFPCGAVTSPYRCFSTRKIVSGYAGFAIRVVRSSDSTDQDIGFDGSNNLDATSLNSFCTGTTCTISIWYDQSGNGNNATGGPATVVVSGTDSTVNGHVCPLLTNSGTGNLIFNGGSSPQPGTISVLFKLTNLSANGAHLSDGATAAPRWLVGFSGGPPYTAYEMYSGGGVPTGGTPDTNTHSAFAIFNDPNSNLFIDGSNVIVNQSTGANALPANELIGAGEGAPSYINGSICEYIVQTTAQSSGDRSTIRTSWQSYWGAP